MRYLIVNGDDFGASRGINRGILEAHQRGILSSTSLMVNRAASEEAALMGRSVPDLSVGLHVDLDKELRTEKPDRAAGRPLRAALEAQIGRFEQLLGRPP